MLLAFPVMWLHAPLGPVVLLALAAGAATAPYPQSPSSRKSDPPRPQDVRRYRNWKALGRGMVPSKRWLAWRRPSFWMPCPVGILLTLPDVPVWGLAVNLVAAVPIVQGLTCRQDQRRDRRHPWHGVSMSAFWTRAPRWQRVTCALVWAVSALFLAGLWQLYYLSASTAVAATALVWIASVWGLARPAQIRAWNALVGWQERIDDWIDRDDGLKKAWGEAVVTSVTDYGSGDDPLTCLYIEPRVSGGTAAALRLGVQGIAPVATSDGYREVHLLMALTRDKNSRAIDPRKLRLVLARDHAAFPDISRGSVAPALAALMCDLAYAGTAAYWRKGAPLTRPVNISAEDEERNAWLIRFVFPHGGGVPPLEIISRDWLADEHNPGQALGMPLFADPTGKWHLAADPDIHFSDKADRYTPADGVTASRDFDTYVQLSHRFVADRDKWQSIIGSRLPLPMPLYDTERETSTEEGWTGKELDFAFTPPATAADYARLDLSSFDPDAGHIGIRGNGERGTLVAASLSAPNRLDRIIGSKPIHRSYAQSIVYPALLAVLPARAEVQVEACAQEGKDVAIWRITFSLGGGATVADLRKRTANVQAAVGANTVIWDWQTAGKVSMWCMDKPAIGADDIPHWKHPPRQKTLINLVLSDGWSTVGLVNNSGQTPTIQKLSVMPHNTHVLNAQFSLPAGLGMGRIEGSLDKYLTAVNYGYGRILPDSGQSEANTFNLALSQASPFPTMVKADWPTARKAGQLLLPLGVDDMGELVSWDLKSTYHVVVMGKSGTGKSSAAQIIVADALQNGYQVLIVDPSKGAIDFTQWARPLALAFVGTGQMRRTEAAIIWLEKEMHRRTAILSEKGVGNINDLPETDRHDMPRILLVFDEFNSYLSRTGKTAPNPAHDIDIANANATITGRNNSITRTVNALGEIALQGRTSGISIMLGAQRLTRKHMERFSNGSDFFTSLGKMMLGNDGVDGIFADSNVVAAHRLQNTLKGDGGKIPHGRGMWEDMDGHMTSIQTWYSGGQEALSEVIAGVAAPEPIDLEPYMPQETEHFGEIEADKILAEETTGPRISEEDLTEAEAVDLGDWSL